MSELETVHAQWITWTATAALVGGTFAEIVGTRTPTRSRCSRAMGTSGNALLLIHIAMAFHWSHGWSHSAAYESTAVQTENLIGWRWGGGLWANYAFTIAWTFDTLWAWWRPDERAEAKLLRNLWRAVFAFMAVNAAIVFGNGPARIVGIACVAIAVVAWWKGKHDGKPSQIISRAR